MRRAIFLVLCFYHFSASADADLHCSENSVMMSDEYVACVRSKMHSSKDTYDHLYARVVSGLEKHVEEGRSFGWGVDAKKGLSDFRDSEEKWRSLVEADCNLKISSPASAGGQANHLMMESCIMERYKVRVEHLKDIAYSWLLNE